MLTAALRRLKAGAHRTQRMRLAAMAQQPGSTDRHARGCSTDTGRPAATPAQPTLWQQLLQGGRKRQADDTGCRQAHSAAAASSCAGNRPAAQRARPPPRAGRPAAAAAEGRAGETDLGSGSAVVYQPAAFTPADSRGFFEALREGGADWQEREVTVMGRRVKQPRLVAYMADEASLAYTYSGTTLQPQQWSAPVLRIKARVEELAGARFNSCLLNCYRDGRDHMGWHSDNEPLYGSEPTIGSVSLGARRDFVLRCNADHGRKLSFPLGNGDALIMKGTTQQHWMHAVPRRKREFGSRINLTFRTVVKREGRAA